MQGRVWLAVAFTLTQVAALPELAAHASAVFIRPPVVTRPPRPQTDLDILRGQLKVIELKGESWSIGRAFRSGGLENPAGLPMEGVGYWALRPERGAYYGTDDMIAGLIETCAALKQADPLMPPLAIGDISGPRGGRISLHLSHRSGRDADLLFWWTDKEGRPILTEDFVRFNARGRGLYRGKTVYFDVPRNWALVRQLLANRRFGERVTRIFVSMPLRKLLLAYAKKAEGDRVLLRRARRVMWEPADNGGRHEDHFHVRIGCSARETASGCRD